MTGYHTVLQVGIHSKIRFLKLDLVKHAWIPALRKLRKREECDALNGGSWEKVAEE